MRGKSTATPKKSQKKTSNTPQSSVTGSQPSKSKGSTDKSQHTKCHDSATTKKGKTPVSEVPQCEECGIIITDTVAALQCDRCEGSGAWKCQACLGLSEELYQELITSSDLRWFCQECDGRIAQSADPLANNGLDTVMEKVNHLLATLSDWESRLTERVRAEVKAQLDIETQYWKSTVGKLEDKIENCELKVEAQRGETYAKVTECDSKISNLLRRDMELVRSSPGCSSSHPDQEHDVGNRQVKAIIEQVVNQQQLEDKEIEARRNNVVLYNIPENFEERHEVRLAKDKQFIMTMCDDVAGVPVTEQDISKCIRLGAFENSKTRPILLGVTSEIIKDSIMKMGKDLGLSGSRYNKIGIAQDYTPKQREENRKLLAEVKAEIIAQGDQPENYKLYVVRRNSRAEVIKKKRIKPKQAPQESKQPQQSPQQLPPQADN